MSTTTITRRSATSARSCSVGTARPKPWLIGAGGFLGIGEHDVAVPFSEVKFVDQPRNTNTSDNRPAGANTNTANLSRTDGRPSGADAAPTTAGPVPTTGAATTCSNTGASNTAANRPAADNPSASG